MSWRNAMPRRLNLKQERENKWQQQWQAIKPYTVPLLLLLVALCLVLTGCASSTAQQVAPPSLPQPPADLLIPSQPLWRFQSTTTTQQSLASGNLRDGRSGGEE